MDDPAVEAVAAHVTDDLAGALVECVAHDQSVFGLSPGPVVGELLEALRETQAAGEVTTRRQALAYIRNLLAEQGEK